MKKHVRVVYDRKKVSAKTGTGKIELSIYLKEGERKWITVTYNRNVAKRRT